MLVFECLSFFFGQLAWYCSNLLRFRRILAFRIRMTDTEREDVDFSALSEDEDEDEDDEDDDD